MAVSLGRLEVETADHVVLRYDLAGAGTRGAAAIIDGLLSLLMVFGLSIAAVLIGSRLPLSVTTPLAGVAAFLILVSWVAYFVLLEWLWNGQTIGKRRAGLRVIGPDGEPARFTAVLIRNLVRLIDFLPGWYALGVVMIFLTPGSQRLGDLAAGTYVVRAPKPRLDWLSLRTLEPSQTVAGVAPATLEDAETAWLRDTYKPNEPNLTVRAVIVGVLIGGFMSLSNIYVFFKTGWSLGVTLTACIIAYAAFQAGEAVGLVKRPLSVLENNALTTVASGASTTKAAVSLSRTIGRS